MGYQIYSQQERNPQRTRRERKPRSAGRHHSPATMSDNTSSNEDTNTHQAPSVRKTPRCQIWGGVPKVGVRKLSPKQIPQNLQRPVAHPSGRQAPPRTSSKGTPPPRDSSTLHRVCGKCISGGKLCMYFKEFSTKINVLFTPIFAQAFQCPFLAKHGAPKAMSNRTLEDTPTCAAVSSIRWRKQQ